MMKLQGYEAPKVPLGYNNMVPNQEVFANQTNNWKQNIKILPVAPPLAVNTLFRSQSQRVLPMKPDASGYNYGGPQRPYIVPSSTGMVPKHPCMDGSLAQIGKNNYKVLEPVNLYTKLPINC
jgi:hypothetical protein